MNFKVGQKVVCVKTAYDNSTIKDRIYIIEGINHCCQDYLILKGVTHGGNCCDSCGIVTHGRSESKASRFAPIIENTSTADIANQIFEQHPELKEIKIPELV